MQRVKRSTAVAVLPADPAGGTPGYFPQPNPGGGVPAAVPGYEWYNNVQEELMSVIEGQSLVANGADRTQLRQAISKMIQAGQRAVIIDTATFNAGVVSGNAVYWDSANTRFDKALADGSVKQNCVGFADVANAKVYAFGDAVLFAGLTPGARYYLDVTTAGAITSVAPATNIVFVGIAKGATEIFVDVDPLSGLTQSQADARYCNIGYMLVQHQAAQNTAAGGASAGIQTRPLNTVVANTISGAALASNQITLPGGTYRVRGFAEAFHVNASKITVYNVTDATYIQQGGSVNGESALADSMTSEVSLFGRFTLAATKVLELRQYCEISRATDGLGYPSNSMGVEVYAGLEIIKES